MIRADRKNLIVLLALLAAVIVGSVTGVMADTKDGKAESVETRGPATLREIGLSLESARLVSYEDRKAAVAGVAQAMEELLRGDVPKQKRCAARFLSGEIHYALGEYSRAAEEFRNAGKEDKQKVYADDAAAAYIISLEAAGRDEKAAREWKKWDKKYRESPFRPEVLVVRSWNALRRDRMAEAVQTLTELKADYPWMESDHRVVLAYALVAYLEERYRPVDNLLSIGTS